MLRLQHYIGHPELLTFLSLVSESVRNLRCKAPLEAVEEGTFSFAISSIG